MNEDRRREICEEMGIDCETDVVMMDWDGNEIQVTR